MDINRSMEWELPRALHGRYDAVNYFICNLIECFNDLTVYVQKFVRNVKFL